MLNRRQFINGVGIGGLGLSLPKSLLAQTLTTTSLGSGISLITGAGCHVVVAVGDESVIVIDGGLQQNAQSLLQEINKLADGKPIRTLFNTNWRPEHTGLNYLLGGTGTEIIAHENTRLWQSAEFDVDWENQEYMPLPEAAQATKSFYKRESILLDNTRLSYGYLPQAHTDGDIYLYFESSNILVVSDLMGAGRYPIMDYSTGGWIGGMQRSTAALLEIANDETRIIASEGPVQSKADLQAQAEMFDIARELVRQGYRSGRSMEEFIASRPEAQFNSSLGNPDLFLVQLYKGTWGHVRELGGVL